MNGKHLLASLVLLTAASCTAYGQEQPSRPNFARDAKATPAYEVLILRKVADEPDLLDLRKNFTSDSELVKTKRFELTFVTREIDKLQRVEQAAIPKLTAVYGDLLLRRVALEVQLEDLRGRLTSDSPDFTRTRTELAVLDREIAKLLD
jgi:hypothetical protein